MADALVIPLHNACTSLLEPKLGDLLPLFSTPQEMQRLAFATAAVREVIKDAKDGKRLGLEALGDQLDKLTYAACEVGHLLQEWRARAVGFERERIKEHTQSRIDQVAHFLLHHLVCYQPKLQKQMPTPTLDDFYNIINQVENLGENVKELKQMLETICKERVEFSFEEIRSTRSNAFSDESKALLGRASDQDTPVNLLLNEEDHHIHAGQGLPLVFVKGVKGVGKTTLAQAVLNDQRVKQHFDFKLWVHVSDVLDEKMVCKAIIMSATGRDPTKDDDEWSLVLTVNKLFVGKKYLLVLDDVRKGSQESWGRLMLPLGGGAKGAKILVTTCNTTAAEMTTGSAQVHQLEPLLEEDCWALLQHLSSHRAGDHGVPHELEELGREIARKC